MSGEGMGESLLSLLLVSLLLRRDFLLATEVDVLTALQTELVFKDVEMIGVVVDWVDGDVELVITLSVQLLPVMVALVVALRFREYEF